MSRVFFFLLLGFAIYYFYRSWRQRRVDESRREYAETRGARSATGEAMVQCAACGVHLPRPDALPRGELYYCSEKHRQGAAS